MSGLSNLEVVSLKSLENLQQFEAFFDMVRNPDKYAKIVADAKDTIAKAKSVVEAYTTVDLANEYLTKAKAFANEKTAEIEAKVQAAQEASAKREAQIEARRVEAQEVIDKANALMKDATAQQKDLATLSDVLEGRRVELNAFANELSQREANLQTREKELNQKAAKLKEIVG